MIKAFIKTIALLISFIIFMPSGAVPETIEKNRRRKMSHFSNGFIRSSYGGYQP